MRNDRAGEGAGGGTQTEALLTEGQSLKHSAAEVIICQRKKRHKDLDGLGGG